MTTLAASEYETIDPASGEVLVRYAHHAGQEVDAKLDRARDAFKSWRTTGFAERASILRAVAANLRAGQARIAAIATAEMGKPITEAEAEVEKCAWGCEYYAEHAERMLGDEPAHTNAARSYVAFRPIGIVLAVMPWNFPYWQVFRFAAPALMAGNVAVLKHAANVSACALEIERVFEAAGAPQGVFTTLLLPSSDVARVIEDDRIAAVTLTGSDAAGSAVAAVAGRAIKKTVLELGGSDAFIVLADADVDGAAQTAVRSRFQNAGQSCIAAKRFIVEAPVYDDFIAAFAERTSTLRVGDPKERTTQVGPLARADLRDSIEAQVRSSLEQGARAIAGGKRVERRGFFYEPTVVGDVVESMPLFVEETFGPAAAVVRADDAEHAIRLANASPYGLGGNLWTSDIARGERIAARLESGNVFINGMTASDPRLPFGGQKRSGYGRELSAYGIKEFVNIQTIWIGPG